MPRRSGSPWKGTGIVFVKALTDPLRSPRMLVLQWLILLTGIGAVFTSIQALRSTTGSDPFLFLRLFTDAREPLPSFIAVLSFLIPLMAIGLGFDSINGEFNRRTLSRVLSQPIYRDALLLGKFGAALATLAIALVTLWLLIVGLGLWRLGVPPGGEEVARGMVFLVIAIAYGGVWLAIAMLCSVLCRSPATAALSALGAWLLLSMLWPLMAQFVSGILHPQNEVMMLLGIQNPQQVGLQQALARLSPGTLFGEAVVGILQPMTRSLGVVFTSQMRGAVAGAPLSFGQSLLLVWPQATGLVAGAILLFSMAYVSFQRQEVRA
jgi:ABC-2 type transport system permease protein